MLHLRHWKHYRRRTPDGRRGWWIGFMRMLHSRHSRPEAIALGFSIGLLIGFLPLVGVQMALAALLAALLKANPAIAMIPVWITNPVTLMPIYMFTYRIGRFFVSGPAEGKVKEQLSLIIRRIDRHALFDLPAQLQEWARIGRDVFIPMMIGGALVGLVSALVAYPVMLAIVRRFRVRREHARRERLARRFPLRKRARRAD